MGKGKKNLDNQEFITQIRQMVFALYAHIILQRNFGPDKSNLMLTKAQLQCQSIFTKLAESKHKYRSIKELSEITCCHQLHDRKVRMQAHLTAVSQQTLVKQESITDEYPAEDIYFVQASISDGLETISTACITDQKLIKKLNKIKSVGRSLTFDLIPIMGPKSFSTYQNLVLLLNVEDRFDPITILKPTAKEIRNVERIIESNSEDGDLPKLIKDKLIEDFNICGLAEFHEMDQAIDFMLLQACSSPCLRNFNGKLNSLVIGSPGSGKKLLCNIAESLNFVYQTADPSKLTLAGLIGSTCIKDGNYNFDPGFIPRSHHGIFIIQDFHAIPAKSKEDIIKSLSGVMEDGIIRSSNSSRAVCSAQCSIHLDLNRDSQIKQTGAYPKDFYSDLGIHKHILTRFDFITDLPANTERQMDIALYMYSSTNLETKKKNRDISLNNIIAILHKKFPIIHISEKI